MNVIKIYHSIRGYNLHICSGENSHHGIPFSFIPVGIHLFLNIDYIAFLEWQLTIILSLEWKNKCLFPHIVWALINQSTWKLKSDRATILQSSGFLPALRNSAWFPLTSWSSYLQNSLCCSFSFLHIILFYLLRGTGDFWLGRRVSWCFLDSRSTLSWVSFCWSIFW